MFLSFSYNGFIPFSSGKDFQPFWGPIMYAYNDYIYNYGLCGEAVWVRPAKPANHRGCGFNSRHADFLLYYGLGVGTPDLDRH